MKMNKKIFIGFSVILIFTIGAYVVLQGQTKKGLLVHQSSNITNDSQAQIDNHIPRYKSSLPPVPKIASTENYNSSDTIPPGWKTYTNEKYGFAFQYPASWSIQNENTEVANVSGNIKEIQSQFIDSISKASLEVDYYLPPNSQQIYTNLIDQLNKAKKEENIKIRRIELTNKSSRIEGIETSEILYRDGKGRVLQTPLKLVTVDIFNKKDNSEIEFQFQAPVSFQAEQVINFERLVSTLSFFANTN